MNQQTIGIYSGRDDLVRHLREVSPSWSFATDGDQRESCRVVVIDADSHALLDSPPRKSLVRVVLCNGAMPANRRRGEIRVERGVFLDAPGEYLDFAYDLADTAVHASILEQEVSYLAQIRDMMSMIDADAVSERITLTVLDLLGLSTGTLLLHDP
ncbi:MAG: hypothetical protein ACXW2X_10655, partial [Thermoanaerobaculia bacterium]